MAFVDLFGNTLLKGKESGDTSSLLDGKVVGIYFSAHWCPPCRGFTPRLAEIYKGLVGQKNFEIVFASSDKTQAAFDEYYDEMPWLALPFDEREKKGLLSAKFKVRGIPSLVILDEDGSLITLEGRDVITDDPEGNEFPWRPKPLSELIGTQFQGKDGMVDRSALEGKYLGFYFSAHWCPPCRMFTPRLVEVYNKLKEQGKDFEIIFVSGDKNQDQFNEYYGEMPWLAIPYRDPRLRALNQHFGVNGIPHFAMVDPQGQILNKSARGKVDGDTEGANFPWPPLPVEDIGSGTECMGYDINEKPSLIVFMEGTDDFEQDTMTGMVEPIAAQYAEEGKASGDQSLLFFTAKQETGITKQIRKLCSLPESSEKTLLLILDIPDNGGFYVCDAEDITEDVLRNFVQDYKSGERKQLSRG